MRGFLTGSTLGVLLGGTAALGTAILFPAPASDLPPAAPQVDVAVATGEPAGERDVAALDVVTDKPALEETPQTAVPEDEVVAPVADTVPLDEPIATGIEGALEAPDVSEAPEAPDVSSDPVLPSPQSVAPQAPAAEASVDVATAPALAAPETTETPEPETSDASDAVDAPEDDDVQDDAPEATDVATDEDAAAPVIVDTSPDVQTEAPSVISIVTEDGQPLPQGDSGIQVNRPTTEVAPEEAPAAVDVDPNAPALVKYAAAFENPDDKPLLSIVLFDRGEVARPQVTLAQIPFRITIAVDPSDANVKERMSIYQEFGHEIALITEFPDGATPSDIEVALTGAFETIPEAVALVDTGDTGLQGERDVIEQTMLALADEGRGLLTISRGLNTALRSADEAGVPAATIYRDVDDEWQSARIIRRFFDQAAFRARQQSGVVIFGRLRPNTLTALKNWSDSARAEQVAMAPLSAVLQAQEN